MQTVNVVNEHGCHETPNRGVKCNRHCVSKASIVKCIILAKKGEQVIAVCMRQVLYFKRGSVQ